MATSKSKKETWIRSFNVTEPTKHEKGFTVYKVTYRAFRLDRPEEVNEIVVWKRYNDFKKLHQALSVLHYHLRRPEKFPEFAKARFFGRFDENVIVERRQSALKLLEFTVKVPPLAKSAFFIEFFKGGETVTRRKVSSDNAILQPQPVHEGDGTVQSQAASNAAVAASIPRMGGEGSENLGGASAPSSSQKPMSLPTSKPSSNASTPGDELGGVWLHRQEEEEDPGGAGEGGENDEDSEDDRTTFSEDSMPSTPLPQLEELTFFDPLSSAEQGSSELGALPHSNSWLFQAMDICAELNRDSPDLESEQDTAPPSEQSVATNDSTDSGININATPSTASSFTNSTSSSMTPNRNSHSSLARAYLNSLRAQQAAEEDAKITGITDSRSMAAGDEATSRNRHVSEDSISKWDMSGESDYLYQAAGKISQALDNESVGNYQSSFDAYKAGVAILLKGVVADHSKTRREAVRRKTAQYLMKAEDIYNKYLSAEATNARRWESETMTMEVDPSSAYLRGSMEELKNYKVLGCVDSVLLVLDMTTYQSFIIKSLSKCSVPNTKLTTRVPAYCPYMVRLYRYFETESSIFLILEHATGGKLWNYASPFLKQQQQIASVKQELASSFKSSVVSHQSQRSRSGSNRSGRGIGVDDAPLPPTNIPEQVEEVNETSQADLGDGFQTNDASSISSMEEKMTTSPEIASSYVNLLDACGEAVEGRSVLQDGDPGIKRLSDSNLNDLVNQCANYDDFDAEPVASRRDADHDDSIFMSDAAVEQDEFGTGAFAVQSTPQESDYSSLSVVTSDAQPPPMALFSIDSMESPNDVSFGEVGDSSVFDFHGSEHASHDIRGDKPTSPSDRDSSDYCRELSEDGVSLDPGRVIAEALAVVQEVEQMRKEEAEQEAAELREAVTTSMRVHNDLPIKYEAVHDNVPTTKPKVFPSVSSVAYKDDASIDTRGFGVFHEVETEPGVDLAEFFESGQPTKGRTLSCPDSQESFLPPETSQDKSHEPVAHSISMFDRHTNDAPSQGVRGKNVARSFSMNEQQDNENNWSSFFDSNFTDTKGFGFESESKTKHFEFEPSAVDSKDTLPSSGSNSGALAKECPDILKMPDVPKDVPCTEVDVTPVIDLQEDESPSHASEEDQDVFDTLGQHRQNPDGAPSEEIDRESGKSPSGSRPYPSEKDMNLHINPLASDRPLVIAQRTDQSHPTTCVSISGDDTMASSSVMRDPPSSATVSLESTPQHTFKPIIPGLDKNDANTEQSEKIYDTSDTNTSSLPTRIKNGTLDVVDSKSKTSNGSLTELEITPTHSRTSTLKGDTFDPQAISLPSLSKLFAHLDDVRRLRAESNASTLPESCVRIWASEILVALSTLHAAGIICRDLNPDNILLAEGGHIRLTYFSQWQWVSRDLNPKAARCMYTAPEATGIFRVGHACDWWSYGAILFELLTGQSLVSCHPSGINSHTQLSIPDHISPEAKSLLSQLLQVNPLERLGGSQAGADEIKAHPFFKGIYWSNLIG